MINSLIRQIKLHPLGSCFLIFGYAICILAFSIGINYSIHSKESDGDFYNGNKEHNVTVITNFFETMDFDKVQSSLEELSKDVEVQLHVDPYNLTNVKTARLRLIAYEKHPEWILPLLSGRYISAEEIAAGEKVAVIGEMLKENTITVGEDINIAIEGENYRVVGVAGRKTDKITFDNVLYIPLSTIPEPVVNKVIKDSQVSVFIRKNGGSPSEEAAKLGAAMKEIDKLSTIEEKRIEENFGITEFNLIVTIIMVGLILVTGIINVLNLSVFWILDRRKEISVKKAFGANNYNVVFEVFKDMFFLSLTGAIFAITLQFIVDMTLSELIMFSITPTAANFLLVFLMSLVCGILITSTLIRKIVSIQPAMALKQ
jgi:putative ABC transport system permease protein